MQVMDEQTDTQPEPRHRGPKRTAAQRAADLVLIERMALRGESHASIAEAVSAQRSYAISRQTVSYDIARLARDWEAAAAESFASAKARALRKLEELERSGWESLERSRKDGGPGSVAFVKVLLEVHDRRAKLLGLDAPTRTEISGSEGGPVVLETRDLQSELDPATRLEILRRHVARMEARAGAQPPSPET